MNYTGPAVADLDRLHNTCHSIPLPEVERLFAKVPRRLNASSPAPVLADPLVVRLVEDLQVLRDRGFDPAPLSHLPRSVFIDDLTPFLPLLGWIPFVRVLVRRIAFHLPTDEVQLSALGRIYRAADDARKNPIAIAYKALEDHCALPRNIEAFLPLWRPHLETLPQDFLADLLHSVVPWHFVFFVAHAPHLLKWFPAKRRFPLCEKLSGFLENPESVTAADRQILARWEVQRTNLAPGFAMIGLDVCVEQAHTWAPAGSFDWAPRQVSLPNATVTIDAHGIRRGKQVLAWKISEHKLLGIVPETNALGRDLRLFTKGLETLWLSRFKRPEILSDDPWEHMGQLLEAWIFGPSFSWEQAHQLLGFLRDTPVYELVHARIAPLHPFWEGHHIHQSTRRFRDALAAWGTHGDWVRLIQEFYPEHIPHPLITTALS